MREDTYKLIAGRIVEAMEKRHLSYGELASLTDIPKSTLQRYATGDTRKIPLDRIEAIARETCTSTAYLMGWEENENSPAPEGAEEREKGIDAVEDELRSILLRLGLMPADSKPTAEQVEFLAHIVALLKAYFKK